MISPLELYYEKRDMAMNLYASKLNGLGLPLPSFVSALEQAQQAPQVTETAASDWTDGYNAYNEVDAYNRTVSLLPGYGTGINATEATPAISLEKSRQYNELIAEIGQKYGVPVSLIKAMIQKESSFNYDAVSSAGAQGLMQLMPGTAQGLGVTDSMDPAQNIEGGVKYLRTQLDRFGDIRLALAAYNYGPGRVAGLDIDNINDMQQYDKLPSRLQDYIERILCYEKQFAKAV